MKKAAALTIAMALSLCASSAANASKDGKNRHVTIQNLSSQSVQNLYASPITATVWEEDLLGTKTIAAGASTNANIDNGTDECMYDLKAVMANGKAWEHRKVNVCAAAKWVLGDSGESLQ